MLIEVLTTHHGVVGLCKGWVIRSAGCQHQKGWSQRSVEAEKDWHCLVAWDSVPMQHYLLAWHPPILPELCGEYPQSMDQTRENEYCGAWWEAHTFLTEMHLSGFPLLAWEDHVENPIRQWSLSGLPTLEVALPRWRGQRVDHVEELQVFQVHDIADVVHLHRNRPTPAVEDNWHWDSHVDQTHSWRYSHSMEQS